MSDQVTLRHRKNQSPPSNLVHQEKENSDKSHDDEKTQSNWEEDSWNNQQDGVLPSKVRIGILACGERFLLPPLPDMMEALLNPTLWTLFEVFSNICTLGLLYCFLFAAQLHYAFYVVVFLFWRLAYNVFLGVILDGQSKRGLFISFYRRLPDNLRVWLLKPYRRKLSKYTEDSYPDEFWSWLVFRGIATIILANDGVAFFFLALKSFRWPNAFTWQLVSCYALGFSLLIFCFWSKVSAHRCIGDYAWFWGDFFFRIQGELVFDGVFELFPHPMYTIGYAAYYGSCLIAQSYNLLFISLFSHGSQLLFLMLVEEPHIQRLYSKPNHDKYNTGIPQTGDDSLIHADYVRSGSELTGLLHIFLLRSSDFALFVLLSWLILFSIFSTSSKTFYIMHVIFWRCFHWIGLGYLLYKQSRYGWITKQFQSRGYTMEEAFLEWRRLYNFSLVMNHAVFISAAFRLWIADYGLQGSFVEHFSTLMKFVRSNMLSSSKWATFSGGLICILLSIYGSMSSYMAIGDYGWYYGDFFFEPRTDSPVYTGIYRFMNNPDCILGHLWMYGMAVMGRNWETFWFALLSQAFNVLFLHVVESPHIGRCYSKRREAAALELQFRKGAAKVVSTPLVQHLTSAIKMRAKKEREKIRDKARRRRMEWSHQATRMKMKVLYARQESKAALRKAAEDVRRWNQQGLYTKVVWSLQRMMGES
ncbi:Phosphatidylethanolamine N-methyltransferase [Galdieria sulphuraria]|nr:Phosphatidylethanolamine N-methyltransferase [Galdieria sulphuraria]